MSDMPMPDSNSNAAVSTTTLGRRCWFYAAWVLATGVLFFSPVTRFLRYALSHDNASHTILIPVICVWLIFLDRDRIFATAGSEIRSSLIFLFSALLSAGLALFVGPRWSDLNQLSLYVLALILFWVSGFAFFFGGSALRRARFPLAFLLFTIPFPDFLLEKAIYFLQRGSTEVAAVLFDWSGVPVLRDGFVFHLARVNIEVAQECSGIRSSLALLILAIVVAHFYLRTFWKQVVFVVAGLFVMVLKNGVRIVTLTLLASYVDPGFLFGRLHHSGGVVFFLLGLALLAPLLWLMERGEAKSAGTATSRVP
jgi:exosortase